jgi:DNA-binding transcriptional ArsR family regulator
MQNAEKVLEWLVGLQVRPSGLAVLIAVLAEMQRTGEGSATLNVPQISKRSGVSRRAVRKHLDILAKKNLVTMHRSEHARRSYFLLISPAFTLSEIAPPGKPFRGALPNEGNCA